MLEAGSDRSALADWMRRDLLGPFGGAEERIRPRPTSRYLVGVLHPAFTDQAVEETDEALAQLVEWKEKYRKQVSVWTECREHLKYMLEAIKEAAVAGYGNTHVLEAEVALDGGDHEVAHLTGETDDETQEDQVGKALHRGAGEDKPAQAGDQDGGENQGAHRAGDGLVYKRAVLVALDCHGLGITAWKSVAVRIRRLHLSQSVPAFAAEPRYFGFLLRTALGFSAGEYCGSVCLFPRDVLRPGPRRRILARPPDPRALGRGGKVCTRTILAVGSTARLACHCWLVQQ